MHVCMNCGLCDSVFEVDAEYDDAAMWLLVIRFAEAHSQRPDSEGNPTCIYMTRSGQGDPPPRPPLNKGDIKVFEEDNPDT